MMESPFNRKILRDRFFPVSFTKLLRTHFSQNTSGRLLVKRLDVKKFNSVSPMFLKLQLYHTPPE